MSTAPTSKSLQGQSATGFVSTNQPVQLPAFAAQANSTSPTRHSSFIVSETSGPRGADVPNGVPIFFYGSVLHDDGWVSTNGFLRPTRTSSWPVPPGNVGARSTQLNSSWFVHGPSSHVTPCAIDQPSLVLCFRCVSVNIIVLKAVCRIHCKETKVALHECPKPNMHNNTPYSPSLLLACIVNNNGRKLGVNALRTMISYGGWV